MLICLSRHALDPADITSPTLFNSHCICVICGGQEPVCSSSTNHQNKCSIQTFPTYQMLWKYNGEWWGRGTLTRYCLLCYKNYKYKNYAKGNWKTRCTEISRSVLKNDSHINDLQPNPITLLQQWRLWNSNAAANAAPLLHMHQWATQAMLDQRGRGGAWAWRGGFEWGGPEAVWGLEWGDPKGSDLHQDQAPHPTP